MSLIPWWVWILIILIILLVIWIWKKVIVPVATVATDKAAYFRAETAHISGTVKSAAGVPLPGAVVHTAIEPPVGDVYNLPDTKTDATGKFALDWEVPGDAPDGTYTLSVVSLGALAEATFTQIQIDSSH